MSPWLVNWLLMALSRSWPPLSSWSETVQRSNIWSTHFYRHLLVVQRVNKNGKPLMNLKATSKYRHFSSYFHTLSAKTLLWSDIFASTKKEGNTWWWDSPHDLQRPRGSTCSVTAWLTFILNLNIHFGFPGMLVLRHSGKRSSNSQTLKNQVSSDMAPRKQQPATVIKAADIWFSSFHI